MKEEAAEEMAEGVVLREMFAPHRNGVDGANVTQSVVPGANNDNATF